MLGNKSTLEQLFKSSEFNKIRTERDKLKKDNEVLLNALKVIKTTLKGMIAGRPHSYDDAAKEGVERIDNLIKQCESK